MAAIILILLLFFVVSFYSEIHALGLWLALLIAHGFVVGLIGDIAVHLPMYVGIIILVVTIGRGKWVGVRVGVWLLVSTLVTLMALAAILGEHPQHSIVELVRYSKGYILAIFVAGVIREKAQIETITVYCIAAVLLGACIAIWQHMTGNYVIDNYGIQRAGGLSDDPNDTAMLLLTGIPITIYWFTNARTKLIKVVCGGIFALAVGAIMLTQSRGGAIALALVLTIFFLWRPNIKALFFGGVVLVVAALMFMTANYWERIESISTVAEVERGSISKRRLFIEVGIDLFVDNPLFGIGMGNFGSELAKTHPEWADRDKVAHNMYLDVFVENGVIAGLVYLALLASAFFRPIQSDRFSERTREQYGLGFCFAMSLFSLMAAGLFLSQADNAVLWFFVGIGLAFPSMARRTTTSFGSQQLLKRLSA